MAETIKKGEEVVWCVDALGKPTAFTAERIDDEAVRWGRITKLTAEVVHVRPHGSHPNNGPVKVPVADVRKAPPLPIEPPPGDGPLIEREGGEDTDPGPEALPALKFMRLSHGEGLPLPAYKTAGAAGLDVCAATSCVVRPGERRLIPTGWAVEVPEGFELQVRPRSGLALSHGLTVLNSPGTIDCDYRGEVFALIQNTSLSSYRIERGERIAQLVPQRVPRLEVLEVDELTDTERGAAGYGSTGRA